MMMMCQSAQFTLRQLDAGTPKWASWMLSARRGHESVEADQVIRFIAPEAAETLPMMLDLIERFREHDDPPATEIIARLGIADLIFRYATQSGPPAILTINRQPFPFATSVQISRSPESH